MKNIWMVGGKTHMALFALESLADRFISGFGGASGGNLRKERIELICPAYSSTDLLVRLRSGADCKETWCELAGRTNRERTEAADRIEELELLLMQHGIEPPKP